MSTTKPTESDLDTSGVQVVKIRFKRATAAIWGAVNPILLTGEPGYETDSKRWKIGDGSTRYNDLTYQGLGADVVGLGYQIVAHFSDIDTVGNTSIRMIEVSSDETNNGDKSIYVFNGSTLRFFQTIQIL